jgi:hypothetical protein
MDTISLFDLEIETEMNSVVEVKDENGVVIDFRKKSYLEAKHDAIDNYRKFTKRQVQGEAYEIMSESFLSDEKTTVDDEIEVQQMFAKMINLVYNHKQVRKSDRDRAIMLVCAMFRMNELEELLGDDAKVIREYLGDFYPETEMEIAKFLGYSVNPRTGSCGPMTTWKQWLFRVSKEAGLAALV